MLTITIRTKNVPAILTQTVPTQQQIERERMVMRETDQWMSEYNKRRGTDA